jgi:AcrR family transcriptional regulator
VSSVHEAPVDDGTVRDRLIKAADAEIALHGIGAVKMEAVAKRAGVSRATAFRQMGTIYELLVQVALSHAKRHETAVRAAMAESADALSKLEAALIYSARELPLDRSVYGLITQHSTSAHHPGVHLAGLRVLESVLQEGRNSGEIRSDVGTDELVDFVMEQAYLAAEADDRSEDAVRRRFRYFIVPGLMAPKAAEDARPTSETELQVAVRTTLTAVEDLADKLRGHGIV